MLRLSELTHEKLELFYDCVNHQEYEKAREIIECFNFERETCNRSFEFEYSIIPEKERWVLNPLENVRMLDCYRGIRTIAWSLVTKHWLFGATEIAEELDLGFSLQWAIHYVRTHPLDYLVFDVITLYEYNGEIGDIEELTFRNTCTIRSLRDKRLKKVGYRLDESTI